MNVLSPRDLGPLSLANRVVMAPMTRSRALGGVPNALMADYYAQRASAGLIITEGTAPSPDALGYARIPGLFSDAQIAGWRLVTDKVHAAGGRIIAQLMHVGRIAHEANLPAGARVVAPSAVTAKGQMWTDSAGLQPMATPIAMDAAQLETTRNEIVQAAKNAIAAGFDGVELHGANGYLLEQFLNPQSNQRDDEYGGSIAGRIRYVVEVVRATAAAIGADRVGIRLSPFNTFNDLSVYDETHDEYVALARELRGIMYLHIIAFEAHAAARATAAAMKDLFGGPVILNGGLDRASADRALEEGRADLVSFGRPFIANPDLVRRLAEGLPQAPPNAATFYTPGPEGYTDYPAA
jgi:N-ethylmaleimide reductase